MNLNSLISDAFGSRSTADRPSVQLALDGEPIYLHYFNATVKMVNKTEDMSGQDGNTNKSSKGTKAKELYITGLIPFNRPEWLTALFQLAEAKDEKGDFKKYRISSMTAEAVNFREGYFGDEISAVEKNAQGWDISFKLSEVNSIAEKRAKQAKKPTAKTQTAKGKGKKASKKKSSGGGDSGFMIVED